MEPLVPQGSNGRVLSRPEFSFSLVEPLYSLYILQVPVWALCRWGYDTKMHLKEAGQEGVGTNHLTEDGDQWWNIVNILTKNLQVFFFKCKEILYILRDC